MRIKFLVILAGLCPLVAYPQGTIDFMNSSLSLITNGLTGLPVTGPDRIRVALYYAPDGTTNHSDFIQLGASTSVGLIPPIPGRFIAGTRTTPDTTCGGCYALVQVRAYEATYGNTYEEALAAAPIDGRPALTGLSAVLRTSTGFDFFPPVRLSVAGLVPFTVYAGPQPPTLSIAAVAVREPSMGITPAQFVVRLEPPSTQEVAVAFATIDGTAVAGSDYVATNGTLIFLPGQMSRTIEVGILADPAEETSESFSVQLSDAINAELGIGAAVGWISEVRITDVRTDTRVTFHTVATRRYVVERSSDMVLWATVSGATNVVGTGGLLTVNDPGSGCDGSRYYRARLID
jgi:hypothetical protein